jgi:hypothetical protein
MYVLKINGIKITWSSNKKSLQTEAKNIRELKRSMHVRVVKDESMGA